MSLFPYLSPPSTHGNDELCATRAEGHRIVFADGRTVLDGNSGLWNTNLGYNNPVIAEAISKAAATASYLGAFRYENVYARKAATALLDVAGPGHYDRVLFASSGGAANDAAMKAVRQYQSLAGRHRRNVVVSLRGSYHGLTFGGFALTGEDLGQRVCGVDTRLIRNAPPNDVQALGTLMERVAGQVAAVVVEPVIGSGTVPLTDEFINELLRWRQETGLLLVADEVATGFGRTGPMFASQQWAQQPDILITSKGLTNGTLPASALLLSRTVSGVFAEHDEMIMHAETQGGSSLPAAAISATIAEMDRLDALGSGRKVADLLDAAITDLAEDHVNVVGSAGTGCFRTLHVVDNQGEPLTGEKVAGLVTRIRRNGAIVHPGPGGVQLVPALTYTGAEMDELAECVGAGLSEIRSTP